MNQVGGSILDIITRIAGPGSTVLGPLTMAIGAFLFLIGIGFTISAVMAIAQVAEGRSQQTAGSMVMKTVIGFAIVYTGGQMAMYGMDLGKVTLFGVAWETVYQSKSVVMVQPTSSATMLDNTAVQSIVTFISFVGALGLIRGLFLLGRHTDGDKEALGAAAVHLIAGFVASNFGAFLKVVEDTLQLGLWS